MIKERVYEVVVSQKIYKLHHVWARNQAEARQKLTALIANEDIEIIESMGSGFVGDEKIERVRRDDGYLGAEKSTREQGTP